MRPERGLEDRTQRSLGRERPDALREGLDGTATGKRVGAAASATFKKLSLELGGKNATIVLDDAEGIIVLKDSHDNKVTLGAAGVTIKSGKDLILDAASGEVTISGKKVDIQ